MRDETPFDVWDGEGLETAPADAELSPEEDALHVVADDAPTDPHAFTRAPEQPEAPVSYFADEEPEVDRARRGRMVAPDEHEPDLEEVLQQQHYA